MSRTAWVLATLLVIGSAGVLAYLNTPSRGVQTEAGQTEGAVNINSALAEADTAQHFATATAANEIENTATINREVPASKKINEWLSAAIGDDAVARATAIEALASAPKVQALAVLQKVLSDGAEQDRQLALTSLQALALKQGDADGDIRNVLRLAIYDGGDDAVTSNASVILDDIEHDATSAQKQ